MSHGERHPWKFQRKIQEERRRWPDLLILSGQTGYDPESLYGVSGLGEITEWIGSYKHQRFGNIFQQVIGRNGQAREGKCLKYQTASHDSCS